MIYLVGVLSEDDNAVQCVMYLHRAVVCRDFKTRKVREMAQPAHPSLLRLTQ